MAAIKMMQENSLMPMVSLREHIRLTAIAIVQSMENRQVGIFSFLYNFFIMHGPFVLKEDLLQYDKTRRPWTPR